MLVEKPSAGDSDTYKQLYKQWKQDTKEQNNMRIAIVEKANHNAVHAYCSTRESAERYLRETVPVHCARGYYMDKTLTPDSFEIEEK